MFKRIILPSSPQRDSPLRIGAVAPDGVVASALVPMWRMARNGHLTVNLVDGLVADGQWSRAEFGNGHGSLRFTSIHWRQGRRRL
jgi:hypothetical protein